MGDSNTRGISPAVYKTAAVAAEPILHMEREGGNAPPLVTWQATVLLLYYARIGVNGVTCTLTRLL